MKKEVDVNIDSNSIPATSTTRHISLRDFKRLPIDISKDGLMDPVNIPSKLKLFQASSESEGAGSLFGYIQYNIFEGFRVSARSLDNRIKLTHDITQFSTPIKGWIANGENLRGVNETEVGASIDNLYSTYKTRSGSVFQVGCSGGLRLVGDIDTNKLNSDNGGTYLFNRVRPFISPKFTYFGKLGWIHVNTPINRKGNRVELKHNFFFNVRGNTILSGLEYTTSRFDRYLRTSPQLKSVFSQQPPDDVKETIHYKLVHVASSTELGLRRIRKIYGVGKWQIVLGIKHNIQQSVFIQCLFTHTIGDKTTFGLSLGLDL
ncbi:hypothetical protein DFA_11714 [Cavenderia fasciculata]|uniref:Uncharacterized protein n=1 Tax=Cavenderia fasciculata TaxID=261658 RepID=F4QE06_CACFS|nr:uncharacterized protein DFA_11714 [Cavenderia fasciculata]EGG13953.1 hypothetical protein DFA_11714 [Cavenderia fasciculata]|eukprot:XP_004350661.1 hypothetical protein DFA_11714 [Cavenderia fasciculata]